ncbi:DUF4202 domain-containing protein [Prosthecomicrobium sp. N25]|uniref:DUF4202 domain-containing protein n=1 Tax=Prosthecomicrobium sp. N25 TaxID=3129254 RepID=UPI00307842E9
MPDPTDRLARAYAAIDAANAADPTLVEAEGGTKPYAVLYGERMSHWLDCLVPDASDALRIAVRAQHIRRFDIPRSAYPLDKPGYHAWRNRLKDHHADLTAALMAEAGYGPDEIARARSIVRKERLKRDPEAQALEDCACLVFLENEFVPFAARHEDDKIVDIVAKTWVKMSDAGHALALGLVPALPDRLQRLVGAAVAAKA